MCDFLFLQDITKVVSIREKHSQMIKSIFSWVILCVKLWSDFSFFFLEIKYSEEERTFKNYFIF